VLCLSPGKGGLELYAFRSSEIVEGFGCKCVTVCRPDSSLLNTNSESDNTSIFALKVSFHLLPLFAAFKLSRIINQNKIDIIHIHWNKDLNVAVFAKIFSTHNVKLIYTRHMAITRFKNDLYHKFLYCKIDCFVVITKQLKKEAIKYLPISESKIKLLYHGTNKPVLESNSNRVNCDKFKITSSSSNYLHIAIFSRIEEGKGQHLLIEAVHALKIKNKEIHVTVIGHVMDYDYFQKLKTSIKNYQLEKQFHFHQFIEKASLYMKCFDVITLTTYAETFGLVLIEAMQSGVAVLGSNAGGVPEIINDKVTGLLFKSRDVESLTKKIEFYYDNPNLRKEIAIQGQRFVEVNFSEEQHKKALNEILKSI